jgi:DNA-binding XRE family transcriptional regulator
MPKNRIRQYRLKANLTQAQLARLAKTSQQQIQRIEGGVQAARLDLAARICAALNASVEEIFPEAKKALSVADKLTRGGSYPLVKLYEDEAAKEGLKKAGLDMDVEEWSFKFELSNGFTATLPISGPDRTDLWGDVQTRSTGAFLVFTSGNYQYAVNRDHVVFCQFMFDVPGQTIRNDEGVSLDQTVSVYLATRIDPLTFFVESDEDPPEDGIDDEGQMRGVLYELASLQDTGEAFLPFDFVDAHGEHAFFRSDHVAMVRVNLAIIKPELSEEADDP